MSKKLKTVLVLSLAIIVFPGSGIALAKSKKKKVKITNNYVTNNYEESKEFGAKADAPFLVELTDNLYVGFEGGKDLYRTDADEGWFGYGKVTYTGTLFSFKKKDK